MSSKDSQMIPQAESLIQQMKTYDPDFNQKLVEEAIEFARVMHDGQTRSSGEPYYTHPVEVAGILADMKMDTATIITAILHDTLEDTKATTEDLQKKFSPEVAMLVNGVYFSRCQKIFVFYWSNWPTAFIICGHCIISKSQRSVTVSRARQWIFMFH